MSEQPNHLTHYTLNPPTSSGTTDALHAERKSLLRLLDEARKEREDCHDDATSLAVDNQALRAEVERLRELLRPDRHNVGWMGRIIPARCLCNEWDYSQEPHPWHVATMILEALREEATDE